MLPITLNKSYNIFSDMNLRRRQREVDDPEESDIESLAIFSIPSSISQSSHNRGDSSFGRFSNHSSLALGIGDWGGEGEGRGGRDKETSSSK